MYSSTKHEDNIKLLSCSTTTNKEFAKTCKNKKKEWWKCVMWKQVANPVSMLGWFWDLGLINLTALFYGAPLLLHGVHGCFLSGCVCCKVQGRRRLVLMKEDGAELMKEDGRRRRTVGSRIRRVDCWIGKFLREANGIRGVFGAALEEKWVSFCSGQKKI
jgi:hypothetical protein